jgi:hypothetical protein
MSQDARGNPAQKGASGQPPTGAARWEFANTCLQMAVHSAIADKALDALIQKMVFDPLKGWQIGVSDFCGFLLQGREVHTPWQGPMRR